MRIEVTPEAKQHIVGFLERQGTPTQPIRLRVLRTRCMGGRGHAYRLEVSGGVGEPDALLDAGGVRMVVDAESAGLLDRVRVLRVGEGPLVSLKIENSRAIGKCPCGHHDVFEG